MNAVLTFQQLVGDTVVIHQPARRLPQRRVAERRLLRVFGVEAEVVDQARRESVDTHVGIALQRGDLIGAKLVGDIHIALLDQQATGAGIGDALQQHALQVRLRGGVRIGLQHQRLQRHKLFDGKRAATRGMGLQPAVAGVVIAGVLQRGFAVDY